MESRVDCVVRKQTAHVIATDRDCRQEAIAGFAIKTMSISLQMKELIELRRRGDLDNVESVEEAICHCEELIKTAFLETFGTEMIAAF